MLARLRSVIVCSVIAVLAASWLATAGPASAANYLGAEEAWMVSLVNDYRAQHGLPALRVSTELAGVARPHTANMAGSQNLHHNPNLASQANEAIPGWRLLAENVGVGGSTEAVHQAFLNSSKHRANILGTGFTIIAVGAVQAEGGQLYFTQNFADWSAAAPPPVAPPAPPPSVPAPPPAPPAPPPVVERTVRPAAAAPQEPVPVAAEVEEELAPPTPEVSASFAPEPTSSPMPSFLETAVMLLVRIASRIAFWS